MGGVWVHLSVTGISETVVVVVTESSSIRTGREIGHSGMRSREVGGRAGGVANGGVELVPLGMVGGRGRWRGEVTMGSSLVVH